jgi:cellulose synthase operon protein C
MKHSKADWRQAMRLPFNRAIGYSVTTMTRLWPLFALALIAAAPTADELRQFRIAQATFQDGLYDVAERQLIEFLAKFPASDRADNALYQLAQAQLRQGKWQPAVKSLDESLARWPDKRSDAVRFWLGEAYARGGKYAEAEARYAEVADKYPRSAYHSQALYGLAYVQMKQNQFAAAIGRLDQLQKLGVKDELGQQAELLRGQVFLAGEKYDQADAVFAGVAKQYPASRAFFQANYWLGESRARRQRYDEALKDYAVVIDAFKATPAPPTKAVDAALAAQAWYGAGWADWQTGNFAAAADAFALALANAQTDQLKHDALLKLAEAAARAGKVAEGVARLREFLKAHPDDPLADEVQSGIGDLLFNQGDYAGALAEFTALIAKPAGAAALPRAYLQAGWCAWRLKQYPDALKSFQQARALAQDPGMATEALEKIGDTQFALGQFNDAIATYQRLISSPAETSSLDRALFQLGEAYRRIRDTEAASATFESLVKQYPQSAFAAEAQYDLGQILVGQGKETEARVAFAAVSEKFPQTQWSRNAALAIGESYGREGKSREAIAEFDKLADNGLEAELAQQAFYSRGLCYAAIGQRDKTLADFTDFLKSHATAPLAPDVSYWIGDEYLRQKDYLKAQAQLQSLAETYPASKLADAAQYFAGRAAYSRQDYKTAISLYEGLLNKFTNSTWRCDARFGQGDALSELGQFDNALLVFDSLLQQFADCPLACDAQGRKGDCQFTLGRYEDAIATFQRALECAKDTSLRAQLQFKIGQSYEKLSKLDEALQYYIKPIYAQSAAPDPNEPPERFWSCKSGRAAAEIKEKQQQWRDAITLYQKLADTCPELKTLTDGVIRKIRVQHGILF